MKILFINDCNGNEYSNPHAHLIEIEERLVDINRFRDLEARQCGVSKRGGDWKEIMEDGDISYTEISHGRKSNYKIEDYNMEYKVFSGNY